MCELPAYLKAQALNPEWHNASKVHDWRNYISDQVRDLWDAFTSEQKFALVAQANSQASAEDWD